MNNKDFWEAIKELKPNLFKTYSAIYKLSDNELGYCFASNRVLEEKIGKTNIYRDITELKNLGYIKTIEVKEKTNILERRIYTNQNLKTYQEDLKNFENLLKTYYEIQEGVIIYFNERNPHNTNHFRPTLKNEEGGTLKNEEGGTLKNEGVTISNNNLSKIKQKTEIRYSASDLKKNFLVKPQILIAMFDKHIKDFDKSFITELATSYKLEEIEHAYRQAISKNAENVAKVMRKIMKETPKTKIKIENKKAYATNKVENAAKKSREALISDFLTSVEVESAEQLSNQNLSILNRVLKNSNYETIERSQRA